MKLIHLIPDFLVNGAGNWKDVKSRELVLKGMENAHRIELKFNIHDPSRIIGEIPADTTCVLLEYSWWPELQIAIKCRLPHCKILVRAHNAEGFQNYARHGLRLLPTFNNLKMYYGCVRNMWRDHLSCKHADFILGISPWDNENYWKYLGTTKKIKDFPYFCPWPFLLENTAIVAWEEREQSMVSMPGMLDRIGLDMQAGYEKFLRFGLKSGLYQAWQSFISGGLNGGRSVSSGLPIQIIPEPMNAWQTLSSSRVLLVLGNKGFGMKTNIIDGIAAGCHVIVHETLFRRLPNNIRSCCISCHPDKPETIAKAWDRIQSPPIQEASRFNQTLQEECIEKFVELFSA